MTAEQRLKHAIELSDVIVSYFISHHIGLLEAVEMLENITEGLRHGVQEKINKPEYTA